jgi:hypothetical protein
MRESSSWTAAATHDYRYFGTTAGCPLIKGARNRCSGSPIRPLIFWGLSTTHKQWWPSDGFLGWQVGRTSRCSLGAWYLHHFWHSYGAIDLHTCNI